MPVPSFLTETPSPDVYLNHLSPTETEQFEITRNIILAVLGATVCDVLAYVPDDIKILKRSKFDFVVFCFIFSRLLAVSYVFLSGFERVLPINSPHIIAISSTYLCMVSMIVSSYLFLRRVQAVYTDQKWVRRTFFLLWVVFSISDIAIVRGVDATFIPETRYYRDTSLPSYVAFGPFTFLFFDTLVLLAISYKIASMHGEMATDQRIPWYTSISGGALPRLSREIVRGGQQYYLITVGVTALVGITSCVPSFPRMLKPLFPVVQVPLMASMACRVYRNTKLFGLNRTFSEIPMPNIPGV